MVLSSGWTDGGRESEQSGDSLEIDRGDSHTSMKVFFRSLLKC